MLQIDCKNCTNHCCGNNPHLTPVLLPSEEKLFLGSSQIIQTPNRKIHVLSKKENGNCIFLNDATSQCTIYKDRPLECQLYPFLLDFSQNKPSLKLDNRFCPQLKSLTHDPNSIQALIDKHNFPLDWIKAYESLEDC